MVSDSDLATRLRDILRSSDLDTTTPSGVRRQLEEFFGVDLSDRKAFIRDQIDAFLQSGMAENPPAEDGEEVAANEEDEPEEEDDGDGGGKEPRKER